MEVLDSNVVRNDGIETAGIHQTRIQTANSVTSYNKFESYIHQCGELLFGAQLSLGILIYKKTYSKSNKMVHKFD